jgi:putative transposase
VRKCVFCSVVGGVCDGVVVTAALSLRKTWNSVKDEAAPWWGENSNEAYASGLTNLAAGLANWTDSHSGARRGVRVRFPRPKSKKAPRSCRFSTGAFRAGRQ